MAIKDPRGLEIRNQQVLGLNTFIMTQARVESTSLIITGVGKAAYWVQGLRPWCSSRSPQSLNSYNTLRVILFHEFWKSPLQLVNTTVFLKSKQHLLKPVFSKMQIDQRKRLFVAERTTSKSDFFSFFQSKSIWGIK